MSRYIASHLVLRRVCGVWCMVYGVMCGVGGEVLER